MNFKNSRCYVLEISTRVLQKFSLNTLIKMFKNSYFPYLCVEFLQKIGHFLGSLRMISMNFGVFSSLLHFNLVQ